MTSTAPRAFLRFLLLLIEDENGLPASTAGKSWDFTPFLACGAIVERRAGAGRRFVGNSDLIRDVLRTHYNIQNLELAMASLSDTSATKGSIALTAGHTKALGRRATRRLSVRNSGTRRITIRYGDSESLDVPFQPGVYVDCFESFIDDNRFTEIPRAIAVICENEENFHLLTNQELSKLGIRDADTCFMFWRSSRIDLIHKFIQKLGVSKVYYYGDFDLGGVSIYESEVLPVITSAELVIPEPLELWLQTRGSPDLYYDQLNKYRNYEPITPSGKWVAELVRKSKKALEQETVDELLR